MMLLSGYASPCLFTAMQDRANAANDVSDAIPQRLPDDLQSVLVGEFYEIFGQRVY
ncbi:Uncharacterised protein [Escherichia coli]|uniref:Uncharacterized protein n=1 Tax=Escherichia coli TaxID=562 RepID=A0A377BFM9_ECOLX|nr:Uncharacterised protein [Escherichia coli]